MDATTAPDAQTARRAKWLVALALCPACSIGFLFSIGGLSLSAIGAALLASNGALLWALAVLAGGTVASGLAWRRMRRAC